MNFWATWCPPCRKELPDLQELYGKFKDQGFVVLAISDEEIGKVRPFVTEHKLALPVLLDPGRKVNERFRIMGIPKSLRLRPRSWKNRGPVHRYAHAGAVFENARASRNALLNRFLRARLGNADSEP